MLEREHCSKCGAQLPSNAPAGECPKCLLQVGIDKSDGDVMEELTQILSARSAGNSTSAPPSLSGDAAPDLGNSVTPAAPEPGTKVRYFGDYELLQEIARGGMGVVYKARQVRLNRTVALKMILAGQLAGAADVRRFQTEAEAAGRLDHPGIVPVFEVGEHDGHHFFSMGLVEGDSLAAKLSNGPLPPKQAAELMRQIADAIQYAHRKGVLHRDLKPSNILLDREEHPRVTDFGLAKKIKDDSNLTATGQVLGTPSYMPPEQASGRIDQVNESSDVYSLGAILYAMLTGRPPFQAASPLDTLLQVMNDEPVAPGRLNPRLPRDLETICRKCLNKEPSRRYASAQALADDLGRWLRHEPIHARPAGSITRGIKWIRRHPAWSSALALGIVLLVATFLQWQITRKVLFREQAANGRAEGLLYRVLISLAEREWGAGNIFGAREALSKCPPSRRGWEWNFARRLCYVTPGNTLGSFSHPLTDGGFSDDGKLVFVVDQSGTAQVWETALRRQTATFLCSADSTENISLAGTPKGAISPDGQQLAINANGMVRVFRMDTQTEVWSWPSPVPAQKMAYSPDGQTLVMVVGATYPSNAESELLFFGAAQGELRLRETLAKSYWSLPPWLAFTTTGSLILYDIALQATADEGSAELFAFDVSNSMRLENLIVPREATSSTEKLVVSLQEKGLEILTLSGGHGSSGDPSNGYEYSWNGLAKRMAYLTQDLNLDLEDMKLHEALPTFGPLIAVAAKKRTHLLNVHVVDLTTRQEIALLQGFNGRVAELRLSPDGQTLLALGGSVKDESLRIDETFGEAMLWKVQEREASRVVEAHATGVNDVAISSDGRWIMTAGEDNVVRVWEADSGVLRREFMGHDAPVKSLSVGRDPQQVASAGNTATLWNSETGEIFREFAEYSGVNSLALRPDGHQLAIAQNARVIVLDADTSRQLFEIPGHAQMLSYSPDGRLLAIPYQYDLHGELKIIDTQTGKLLHEWKTDQKMEFFRTGWGYLRARFSPDSARVAVVGNIGGAHLYDLRSGQLLRKMEGHGTTVWDAAFSSDGTRLATSGYYDLTIKIWDVETGEEVHTLRGHKGAVTGLAFSPDGSRLLSVDLQGILRIWEAGGDLH